MDPTAYDALSILQTAADAHRAGSLDAAEAGYRAVLAHDPENADALHLLGVVQRARGHQEQAITLIRRALQFAPWLSDAHANLGNALCDVLRFDEAAAAYAAALELNPALLTIRSRLVDALHAASRVHLQRGAHAAARERLQTALRLDPDRLDLIEALLPLSLDADLLDTLLLAEHAWRLDGSEASWQRLWDLHNRAGVDVARCCAFAAADPECPMRQVALGNALRRARRGQEAETRYRAAIARAPQEPFAAVRLACLLLEQGRYEAADRLLRQAELLHHGRAAAMRFGRAFLDAQRARELPPLDEPLMAGDLSAPLVVFAACDGGYFERFSSALLHSAVRNAGLHCCFHLHVVNPPEDVARRVAAYDVQLGSPGIALSVEHVDTTGWDAETIRTYFACARFRLLPHLMAAYRRPILMLDTDLIVLRDLSALIDAASEGDLALVATDFHSMEPWNWFWADVVFANSTALSRDYFATVAGYINTHLETGKEHWFLDQIALAACLLNGFQGRPAPRVVFLPSDIHRLHIEYLDGSDNTPGECVLFWSAHASTIDAAKTLAMPRYRDYVLD